ncbi:long-chain fatty acid--CoA ligase [Streptomyces sp. 8L]|uniref:long-chain fatty acid--CoA ligase n=1 Tax=Streptomyces sp. 8L TaxID=2877242 RepID=UPI001CD23AEA|nr:long-chain fatty acid--CoA ligase [Streptomyces sp. 8L]MCA1223615.1 long-chain fatty acid--CoA ligase [Streptomyces sp. 8L]
MLEGLVLNDYPLTVRYILERMRTVYADSTVVTLRDGGRCDTVTFTEIGDRVDRLAGAMHALGVRPGDRVGTLMWNTQEHVELYYAIPAMGAVLHTLNLRLSPEQLTYVITHAEDRAIIVDDSLVPLLEAIAPRLPTVEHIVVVGDGSAGELTQALRYEDLIADSAQGMPDVEIDERAAAALCYTSGTTGNPKGVLYSHRSTVLHAMGLGLADTFGIRNSDRVLPVVPMFHVNAWGLPYAAGLTGASLVLPSNHLNAAPLTSLIVKERVTVAAGVPTIWLDVLRFADEHAPDLSSLRRVVCGGAAVPRSLMENFLSRHGVRIEQAWGMTESSPLASFATPPAGATGEEEWRYRTTGGRIIPLVEARIVGEAGTPLPWDGISTGEVELRGPWIASSYYRDPAPDRFADGWLRTGDIAAIEPGGYVRLTDRTKDVIKSGGEWISSVELENALIGHPAVAEAAVIAKPDERWSERPLACVVRVPDTDVSAEELAVYLRDHVQRWWIPDAYAFIDEIPKTSVGKFHKKVLRALLAQGDLRHRQISNRAPVEPGRDTTPE